VTDNPAATPRVVVHPFAPFVRALGRGKTAGRALDEREAEQALTELGIAPAQSWPAAIAHLEQGSFAYLPLRVISPALQQLMDKRAEFGLRSLHHRAYARLHAETAVALDQSAVEVFRGECGECEIRPDADTVVSLASGAGQQTLNLSRRLTQRAPKPDVARTAPLRTLWENTAADCYGLEAVLQSAAVALLCAGAAGESVAAREAANVLWKQRGRWPSGTV
jgi:anthranilate phosphoribosyltransferase